MEEGTRSERALALKKTRSGTIGHLTRTYREIETLMLNYDNKNAVIKKKEEIDATFEKFRRVNDTLLEWLDDPKDQEEARSSFESQHEGKVEFDEHFKRWIETAQDIQTGSTPTNGR